MEDFESKKASPQKPEQGHRVCPKCKRSDIPDSRNTCPDCGVAVIHHPPKN